ncbi:MAG: NAD(P)/FAD-dependent oxidoreductase [Rhizobiales bacterium]|nr:NAD(P)/FAD-dependent oxidoreductase [Hyphomicrobiales bacterium]
MERVHCIVAGAGVVGLAIARQLAGEGREVILIEVEKTFGMHTSSRNNEVIHAGFLYRPGSLKAQLCRQGRDALYTYCVERDIAHRQVGKMMIATSDSEEQQLAALMDYGEAAGVNDLVLLGGEEARALEPSLHCQAAILSPSTGIVDTHALMLSLSGDVERAGGQLSFGSRIVSVIASDGGFVVAVAVADGETYEIACDVFVNAAGLGAEELSRPLFGTGHTPRIFFAKGNFFSYAGQKPFERLIVPVGETLSRGGSFTFDIGGQGKFGPDLEWSETVDYRVDPARLIDVVAAVRRYYPEIRADALTPGYSGIRPRIARDAAVSDWLIAGETAHGVRGGINLLGIDTPGVTGALAIATHVAGMLH